MTIEPITPDEGINQADPTPTPSGFLSQDTAVSSDIGDGITGQDLRIEDVQGMLPRTTSAPTWIPKRFRDGFALDTRLGRLWYYDFTNNLWRFVSINANSVLSITSSATPTISTDTYNRVSITALAADITSFTTNLSGTPNNFDTLIIRIKDNGTARAITWGTSFEAVGQALPTTTVISKRLVVGFIYDSVAGKWGCHASNQET